MRRAATRACLALAVMAATVFACEAFVRRAEKAAAGSLAAVVADLRADVAAWKANR